MITAHEDQNNEARYVFGGLDDFIALAKEDGDMGAYEALMMARKLVEHALDTDLE